MKYVVFLVMASIASSVSHAQPYQEVYTSVLVRPLTSMSVPVSGTNGKFNVTYELEITNAARSIDAKLLSLAVLDADDHKNVLISFDEKKLIEQLAQLGTRPVNNTNIERNGGRLLAVELTFSERSDIPKKVVHRITVLGANNPGSKKAVSLEYLAAQHPISGTLPPVMERPVEGDRWVAINSCCQVGFPHRFSVATINGELVNSQRYAIDWMQLDDNGNLFTGSPNKLTNWFSYGAKVIAMGAGKVIKVIDGLPDQLPGTLPDPRSISLETVDGNAIVILFDNGFYGMYGHLKRGSILVKKGDRIQSGDIIAQLGNSGNTSAPHLHFHLMQGPLPAGSNAVPYVLNQFSYRGQVDRQQFIDSLQLEDDFSTGMTAAKPMKDSYPMQLSIIDFGY